MHSHHYISTTQPVADIKHLSKAPYKRAFVLAQNSRLQSKIVEKSRQEREAASHMRLQKRESVQASFQVLGSLFPFHLAQSSAHEMGAALIS